MKQDVYGPRVSCGVPGADQIFGGGLIAANSYQLTGIAGTGKTIFSLQWLLDGLSSGDSAMYITLAEPGGEIVRNARALGWDLEGVDIVDLSPTGEDLGPAQDEYHVFSPSEVENASVWRSIYRAVDEKRPKRLVIDSVTHMRYLSSDEYQFRKYILGLVNFLKESGCTSLLLFDPSEEERESTVALAVDGVIRLGRHLSSSLAIGVRSLQVEKMRGSDFLSGLHPLRITSQGITVFPHVVEKVGEHEVQDKLVESGIDRLDELLGGGVAAGSVTILTGPTGTGKSTLGTQFLNRQATLMRAALFTFEESAPIISARARGLGMPVDEAIASGALAIVRVNAPEVYPDEFLAMVRKSVESDGRKLVMIDGLRGYQLSMEEFGKPHLHIQNLVTYLRSQGVTTLLVNETEQITGASLRATDNGISHLTDNVVLLRYAEIRGRIIKVISCLKKRSGHFQPELRELRFSPDGLQLSEKLENLHGLLSGTPSIAVAS